VLILQCNDKSVRLYSDVNIIMAALCNRASHYIFALRFVSSSSSSSSFFIAKSQPPQIGCLPYFHTWCGPSANLECRSKMCCTRLAGNTGRKKSPFWHHRTTSSGYIFGTEAFIYRQSEKKLLNSSTSSTCPDNMVNFGLLTAEICWRV